MCFVPIGDDSFNDDADGNFTEVVLEIVVPVAVSDGDSYDSNVHDFAEVDDTGQNDCV